MAILVRRVLRWIFLISIFYVLALIGYDYLRMDSAFVDAIAYQVGYYFFGGVDGEAIYDAYDYTIITINLISAILVYTVCVTFFSLKGKPDKGLKRYALELVKGFSFRVLKAFSFILLCIMIISLVDLTGFDPTVYKYGDDFAFPVIIGLTIAVYVLFFKAIRKFKILGVCRKI
ncbi:hypothetical protein CYR40_13385 [Chimaeribacter arupi]|uniref:hypothetical protein n=1 Tax=Chimaeribacter arupi TaxID=2060066 RepID=UPI000C7D872A|nr:hypothetical protein [Chimaeribacter arupi]PLR45356.1 hypothetical protein CYR40_13385 [Chimaeribacter arupi]